MAPLYALLLVGGKSTRMGQDKSMLCYHGTTPEWLRLHALLSTIADQCFLCHRDDQDFAIPAVIDPGNGPLAAIYTALSSHTEARWLVVACDLPLLDSETLENLVHLSKPDAPFTAYRSRIDGHPEPLCAIYEPTSLPLIQAALDTNQLCPRQLLIQHGAHLLDLPTPHALDNANSPADTLEIRSYLENSRYLKPISIRYFAQLREITGLETESIQTYSVTASGLYDELKSRYHFPHKQKHLMLAINGEFSDWATPLKPNDEVVFIPPVAGG